MEKKLGLKVISSAALAGLLFTAAPALQAEAASDNYAVSTPLVQDDSENVTLGTLVIDTEDDNVKGEFEDGNRITLTLPSGVEYETVPADNEDVDITDYVYMESDKADVKLVSAGENFITVEVEGTGVGELSFFFEKMSIDDGVTGDIKVEVEAYGTPITSDFVTIGRIASGDTVTTVSDVESFGIDARGELKTIRIRESVAGVLEKGEGDIELVLPNGYEWDKATIVDSNITASGFDDNDFKLKMGDDKDTVLIEVYGKSSGQPGFISLSGLAIYTPDDAEKGDEVELTIKGNETTREDIIVAKVGDYDFDVEADGDIPTVIAGKTDQEVVDITIDDLIDGTWIEGRTVRLELPSWASWVDGKTNSILEADDFDDEDWKLTVNGGNGDAELTDLEVAIDADAPEGDLTVKITGSQGIDEELVIAKVLPPFKVATEKPEFTIGEQYQELGNITITETEDEALEKDKWVVVKAPNGMYFAETPTVKVADGDIEIDDEDTDDNFFAFRIDGESNKQASEIEISDIKMTLDRTVPVGDIEFEISLSTEEFEEEEGDNRDFDDLIDDRDYYDLVTKAVVGTVTTPVEGESTSVVMNIGSTLYTVDGATKVMDVAPQVIEGRTFTPVRYVAESLGADVAYDDATKTATLTKGETVVEFVLGSSTYTVNGVAQTMDVAAQAIEGRTMLPARYVAQAFGYNVGFDPASKTVVISQ